MMRRWDPVMGAFEPDRAREDPLAGGVPTIALQLIEHPLRKNYDPSSLESVAYGGAPRRRSCAQDQGDLPKSAAGNGWGMTETSANATCVQRRRGSMSTAWTAAACRCRSPT